MKRKIIIGGVVAVATLMVIGGVGATALANSGYYHGWKHGGASGVMAEWLTKELDLTAEQKTKLEPLKEKAIQRREAMRASHEAVHKEIMAQLAADTVDRDRLAELVAMKKAEFAETADMAAEGFAEFHAILTPEQRKTLAAKLADKKKCRDGWKKHHGGGKDDA